MGAAGFRRTAVRAGQLWGAAILAADQAASKPRKDQSVTGAEIFFGGA